MADPIELSDLTGLSAGKIEVLLTIWEISRLSARFGYVNKHETELQSYWTARKEKDVGEKLEQLRNECDIQRASIHHALKEVKEKQKGLIRQNYSSLSNATDEQIKNFCDTQLPKYMGTTKPFLPEFALKIQQFFDVGRDAFYIARRDGNYGLGDGEKQAITATLRNTTTGRRLYQTGSPLTFPRGLSLEEEVDNLRLFENDNLLQINALAFDERLARIAGYKADGRKLGEKDWTTVTILQAQEIDSSLYSALINYGKNITTCAVVGDLRYNAIRADGKAQSAADAEDLSSHDTHDYQGYDPLMGEDVEMMDAGEGPSNTNQFVTDPDATEDEDEDEVMDDDDALPPSSNASGHPLTMKEQAEIFKERLYENFMPNTRRPYIKTPLNLFNRPAGRRPTRQPGFIPPDKKKDVWHHHNLRGNPPPGVSPAYWDKTFNDAHSRVYNRLKKVSNSQVRKIAWDAAKSPENGQMRDLALCLLVERDQLLLPFTDSNP